MKNYADSTLKRMTKEDLIEIIRCLEHNIEGIEKMNSNQFKILMEKDIYKWHDLRKNPEDLPENGEWCCVYLDEVFAEEWVADDFHYAIGKYGYHFAKEKLKHVIAWRYIEPFEKNKE